MNVEPSPRQERPRAFFRVLAVAGLVSLVSLAAGVERSQGHAGEIHTEPAPPAQSTSPKGTASEAGSKEARAGDASSSSVGVAGSGGESNPVPPPVRPDTDPTLHFIALGLLLVAGAGFLVIRRRRALA